MSYTTKLHTLRMLKKQAADLSEFATPAIATGLGAVGGLGVNEFILKNKSLKSRILSALLGGGIGLGIERLVDYGTTAATRDGSDRRVERGEKTTGDISKELRAAGIDPTPKNIDTLADLQHETNNTFTNKKVLSNVVGMTAGTAFNEWWRRASLADLLASKTNIANGGKPISTRAMLKNIYDTDDLTNSSWRHIAKNIANIIKPTTINPITKKTITRGVAAARAARGLRGAGIGLAASIGWNALAHKYLVEKALRNFKTDKPTLDGLLKNK